MIESPRMARLEGWLAARRGRVLIVVVLAAAFVRLIACLQIAGGPLPHLHDVLVSDNKFFDVWARHLAAGDWLQQTPLFPVNPWMVRTAQAALQKEPGLPGRLGIPPEARASREALVTALWEHWMGGTAFYQEPAYAYLVALTYALAGPDVWHVYLWQLLLGVLAAVLVHDLARRMASHTAALAASALYVLSPVLLINEVALLRDSLIVVTTLGLTLLMLRVREPGRDARWLALGLAFGLSLLVKVTFVLFPALLVAWLLATERRKILERAGSLALMALGMAVGLLPAVARNLAVGAPPLALNASGSTMLAVYQTVDASPLRIVVSPHYAEVLLASDGKLLASLLAAARTHASAWDFVALNLGKLAYLWHGYEAPNNVDLYLFQQASPLLAALPVTIVVLAPAAALGLSRRAWPVLLALAASVPTVIMATVVARYRAPVVALLFPLAGAGLVRLAAWASARRWIAIAVAAVSTAGYVAWARHASPGLGEKTRASYYADQGRFALDARAPGLGVLCFSEALRLAPGEPANELLLGTALMRDSEPERALPHLTRAAASLGSAEAHEALAEALLGLGRTEEALGQLRAALAAEPARESAKALLERLAPQKSGEPATRAPP